MPKAYFFKVNNETTWENILIATKEQMNQARKPLSYISIVELTIEKKYFDKLITSILQPDAVYLKYASQSLPDTKGVWKCITIKCDSDTRNIILYTAGRTFPLYVAINTDL